MCSQAWAGDIKMITLNSLCHTSKWHPKLACIYRPLGTEKVYRSDLSLECLARSSLWTFLYGNWVYSKHILSRPTFPSNSPVSHALLSEWNLQFCKRLGLESCTMTVRLVSSSMAKALNYCPVSEASGWLDVLHLVFFYLAEIWDSCLGGWLERVVTFPPLYCHSLSLVIFHNSQSFFFFSFPTVDLFWQSTGRTVGTVCEHCGTNLWDRHWEGGSMSSFCSSPTVVCYSLWETKS